MQEVDSPPLLPLLAASSSLSHDLDPPTNDQQQQQDEPPPSVKITQASRSAWSSMFRKHILSAPRAGDADDLLFFVKVPPNPEEPFYVLRNDSKSIPPAEAADINWEETCYLNLLLHSMEYTIEVSIRQRKFSQPEGKFVSTSLKKITKRVFAAPNHAKIDGHSKAETVELTYPFIYFRIDDYEDAWRDVLLEVPDQIIAVELFATGPMGSPHAQLGRHKLFSGALSYDAILRAVKEKSSAWSLSGPPSMHFFKLLGPRGKGKAQLCVKRAKASPPPEVPAAAQWAMNLLRINQEEPTGPFVCSITWLSVSWFSIMRDVLRSGLAQTATKSTAV